MNTSQSPKPSTLPTLRGRARVNGIAIAYECYGPTNVETVLLIAGINAQLTTWPIELIEELVRRGYRVLVYDHRDVGLSTHLDAAGTPDWEGILRAKAEGQPAPVAYTLDDLARDAVGLLDALGIRRAHVVGISMGGFMAQLVAADHPEHTLSLTSIMSDTLNPELPPPTPVAIAVMDMPARTGDPEGYADDMIRMWQAIGSPAYPTDEDILRARALRDFERAYHPDGGARHGAALFAANDLCPKLRTISSPTVVLHGADDPLVSVEGGKESAAIIAGAELRIVPGMGHDIPLALVETFADAITAAAVRAAKGC
ncbi:MAG: alpha/beta fold hydrolase [Anaerolineae bacterium]